jgi:general secretion pathway protein G
MKTTRTRRPRQGFTLVEMLVVLAILVLLVSMVVPRIIGSQKKADINAAKTQIGMLKGALENYNFACKGYPSTEQGLAALISKPADLPESAAWDGPYVTGDIPKDPWGNEYQYEYPPTHGRGDTPDIWSYGPDREDNTDDDIKSWTSTAGSDVGDDKGGKADRPTEPRRPKAGESRRTESRSRTSDSGREPAAPSSRGSSNRPAPRQTEKKTAPNPL